MRRRSLPLPYYEGSYRQRLSKEQGQQGLAWTWLVIGAAGGVGVIARLTWTAPSCGASLI